MINAGIDLYTVGGVLGHKSPVSTKRYSHLIIDRLADAVSTIGRRKQEAGEDWTLGENKPRFGFCKPKQPNPKGRTMEQDWWGTGPYRALRSG